MSRRRYCRPYPRHTSLQSLLLERPRPSEMIRPPLIFRLSSARVISCTDPDACDGTGSFGEVLSRHESSSNQEETRSAATRGPGYGGDVITSHGSAIGDGCLNLVLELTALGSLKQDIPSNPVADVPIPGIETYFKHASLAMGNLNDSRILQDPARASVLTALHDKAKSWQRFLPLAYQKTTDLAFSEGSEAA